MSDPVHAVAEADASGETKAIFSDIREVLAVDVVNLIWRHLATIEGALPWAWATLRPLYADGSVCNEAAALRNEMTLPSTPPIPREIFATLGLRADDLDAINGVLTAYDHTNAMAAVALTALRARLHGQTPSGLVAAEPMIATSDSPVKLPVLLNLSEMSPGTAVLVRTLNALGTRRPGAVMASMYRHLAHWPSYLSFAWLVLAPLDAQAHLTTAIEGSQRAAAIRADRLLIRLSASALPPPALATAISGAVEPFVGDVIAKMLVICALLRQITASPAPAKSEGLVAAVVCPR